MQRQFTASVYILHKGKVLLIQHGKLKKWLPPGGHVDPNETPCQAAVREAREETGLEVEIISEEAIWIERWNARSLPRPYLCLLEEIPPFGDQPAHQHIDSIYLGRLLGGKSQPNLQEVNNLAWFDLAAIEALIPDEEIFVETQQVLRHLWQHPPRCLKEFEVCHA